jgi:hypothetical protein
MKKPPLPSIDLEVVFAHCTIAKSRGELERLKVGLAAATVQIERSTASIKECRALLSLLQGWRQEGQGTPNSAGKTEKADVAECRGTAVAPAKPEKDYSGSGREGGGGGGRM